MSNSVTKKVKVSDDVNRDILSDLPDSVILHILSFLMTKHAIRTCILSSRWKHLWKCLPSLILRRSDFTCKDIFMEFMYKVLSLLLEFKIPFMGKLKVLKVKIEEIEYDLHMTLCYDKLQNVESEEEAARIRKAFDSGLEPSPLVPDGIVDLLLQNSPSAKADLVDCRENPFRQRL